MKKLTFLCLALLFSSLASALAEESETSPQKFSLTLGGMYGFSMYGRNVHPAHSIGYTATLDYVLAPRSSLLLGWAHQRFNYGSDWHSTTDLFSVGYKHWLTDGQTWRPWVQVGAGYVWERYVDDWMGGHYVYGTGNFQASLGGGLRYAVNDRLGLDASVLLYKDGAPWHWSYREKLLTTSLGVDVKF